MSVQIWPPELPRPERDTWQMKRQDVRRKRQSDGPPGYRRKLSLAARLVTLSLVLSRDQKSIFDRFFDDDCAAGTRLFTMPDPTTESWPILTSEGSPILTGDGQPLTMAESWICAWGDDVPTETILGVEFRMTFSIVVMP